MTAPDLALIVLSLLGFGLVAAALDAVGGGRDEA